MNVPVLPGVASTKIYFTRLLENKSGSLFRLLSPEEIHAHEKSKTEEAAKAEQQLREVGTTRQTDNETDFHDDTDILSTPGFSGVKRWQWSVDFKGMEAYVNEHGGKGGGMTDGWCLNQGWASVTALRAQFQVVDGGSGGTHGGEEIILDE